MHGSKDLVKVVLHVLLQEVNLLLNFKEFGHDLIKFTITTKELDHRNYQAQHGKVRIFLHEFFYVQNHLASATNYIVCRFY
jgi:hypothetical protein